MLIFLFKLLQIKHIDIWISLWIIEYFLMEF